MNEDLKRLTGVDFMMMDFHRPMTKDDIDAIHSQACVDRSEQPREEASVDAEKEPEKRCDICFGPMPCKQHANVEPVPVITSLDRPVERVLARAHNRECQVLVVVGLDKDGNDFFDSSVADAAECIYYLTRGVHRLHRQIDGAEDEDGE